MVNTLILEKTDTYKASAIDQDGLWKKVIAEMFEDFMLFILPDLYKEIDFTKPPDFLQQELFKEIIEEKKGRKIADQIVKVHLKDGKEKWILIHIEVQSDSDPLFPTRMFQYFYRIFDRFDREVVAMAIQTGASKGIIPDAFEYSYFGTQVRYAYNNYIVMTQQERELAQSSNWFSRVVLAAIYFNKTRHDADKRFDFKVKLLLELLRDENIQHASIPALFYFIDYLLRLPEELKEPLYVKLQEEDFRMLHYGENDLPPTVGELMARDRVEVRQAGREEGRQEGIQEGIFEANKNFVRTLISKNYTNEEISELVSLSVEEIESLRPMS